MSNLALMKIGEWSFYKLDEVSNLPTYDELYDTFKKLHNDLMKIGKKNACLRKEIVELSNEKNALQKCNNSLNEKVKGQELEKKTLYNRIISFNEKTSTLHEHMESCVDDLRKESEMLK